MRARRVYQNIAQQMGSIKLSNRSPFTLLVLHLLTSPEIDLDEGYMPTLHCLFRVLAINSIESLSFFVLCSVLLSGFLCLLLLHRMFFVFDGEGEEIGSGN
jgi:hypothetical protein